MFDRVDFGKKSTKNKQLKEYINMTVKLYSLSLFLIL